MGNSKKEHTQNHLQLAEIVQTPYTNHAHIGGNRTQNVQTPYTTLGNSTTNIHKTWTTCGNRIHAIQKPRKHRGKSYNQRTQTTHKFGK